MRWALDVFSVAIQTGHVIWLRAVKPWQTYHCCYAKNTAHVQGFVASLSDRILRAEDAGLDTSKAGLTAKTFLIYWDNGNVLTLGWPYDCLRQATLLVGETNMAKMPGAQTMGIQWQNTNCGTFGRIGTTYETFKRMGGYDEEMLAMGAQDADLFRRLGKLGITERRSGLTSFTISNREEEVERLFSHSSTEHRKDKALEQDAKCKWLPEREKKWGTS